MVTLLDVARINFDMDDDLHARAKSEAALSGRRLYEFIEDAVRAEIDRSKAERAKADQQRRRR